MKTHAEFFLGLAECLGWALLHSLWQGACVAILLALALRSMGRHRAATRHGVCLFALLALAAAVAGTVWVVRPGSSGIVPRARLEAVMSDRVGDRLRGTMTGRDSASIPPGDAVAPEPSVAPDRLVAVSAARSSWREHLEPMLPMLAAGWVLGVALLSLRHLVGWRRVSALRCRGVAARADTQEAFARLLEKFACPAGVRLLESAEAAVPMLAGVFKPVVLMPMSVLCGLSPRELEAILAHELAHFARRDAWSNLAQVAVETMLFYHPAVWWIGRHARDEREMAADDLALEICADRCSYAGALTKLAELHLSAQAGLAATGGGLLARIQRIVRPAAVETPASGWGVGVPALLMTLGLGAFLHAQADDAKTINVAAGESIQAAIDSAPPGAVIRLGAGGWKECIVISRPLTLEGEGWEKTRITIGDLPADGFKKAYADLEARQKAASTPEEKAAVAAERVRIVLQPAVWVRNARDAGSTTRTPSRATPLRAICVRRSR